MMLTVTDNCSRTNKSSTLAFIAKENLPPTKPIVTISESDNKNEYMFSIYSTDPNYDNIRYHIDWDDNTSTVSPFFPSGTNLTACHTWVFAGVYNVTITAEDDRNGTSEPATVTIVIEGNRDTVVIDQTCDTADILDEDMRYAMIGVLMTILAVLAMLVHLFKKNAE